MVNFLYLLNMGLDIFFDKVTTDNIAYFRKANFLIPYFETFYNIEEIYNLQSITIDLEGVEELISRCEEVLKCPELAEDLLPTQEGFFFGSTEYDKYYFNQVRDVLETMTNIVLPKFKTLKDKESIVFKVWW